MYSNYEIRQMVNEWLSTHEDSEKFNIEHFCIEKNIEYAEERNCITKVFRDMVKKVNVKCTQIDNSAKQITGLNTNEKEGIAEVKADLETRFNVDYDISYSGWINLSNDGKFEYTKKIMKTVGIYYRLNDTKNNRKEWIVPIFEQRVEKTKDTTYSRLRCSIKNAWDNMNIIMIDDGNKKTPLECASEIGILISIRSELTSLGGMLDKKISQLSGRMSKLLQPGNMKDIPQ
jgi:hypothetical protein